MQPSALSSALKVHVRGTNSESNNKGLRVHNSYLIFCFPDCKQLISTHFIFFMLLRRTAIVPFFGFVFRSDTSDNILFRQLSVWLVHGIAARWASQICTRIRTCIHIWICIRSIRAFHANPTKCALLHTIPACLQSSMSEWLTDWASEINEEKIDMPMPMNAVYQSITEPSIWTVFEFIILNRYCWKLRIISYIYFYLCDH